MDENEQDLKTLKPILECMINIVSSGELFAQKIMRETCILDAISHMLEHNKGLDISVIENIMKLVSEMIKYQLSKKALTTFFKLGVIGAN